MQHETSDGNVAMHGEGDMSCWLFLNRDLLLDLLWSTLEQMVPGLLVLEYMIYWPLEYMFQVKSFLVKLSEHLA